VYFDFIDFWVWDWYDTIQRFVDLVLGFFLFCGCFVIVGLGFVY